MPRQEETDAGPQCKNNTVQSIFWVNHWRVFVSHRGNMEDDTSQRQRGVRANEYRGNIIIEVHIACRKKQIISISVICETYYAESFMDMIGVFFCN
jgi:hypothetical protein